MRLPASCLLLVLGAAVGCGDANDGAAGTGGSGGNPLGEQSFYQLNCTIDTLLIEIPIELSYELDRPYTEGGSAELTFSAAVTFGEQASTALVDAGVGKIDIISLEIGTSVAGAMPAIIETSLAAAPINDFDLEIDTDDNGIAGPHRLELDAVTVTTTVIEGADEVDLGLGLDGGISASASTVCLYCSAISKCRPIVSAPRWSGFSPAFPWDRPNSTKRPAQPRACARLRDLIRMNPSSAKSSSVDVVPSGVIGPTLQSRVAGLTRPGVESSPSRSGSRSRLMPIRTPEPGGTHVKVSGWPGTLAAFSRSARDHAASAAMSGSNWSPPR
ncbi:MAG: hypothetical protein JRG93_20295 [Deltaproteobacteria bacterium]|nr:hypothetical protein [Deltaproteobacteria bacterium]